MKNHTACTAARRLKQVVLINPNFPTITNRRGSADIPEMHVGGATLPLLASLVRRYRPSCRVTGFDEIGTPVDMNFLDNCRREETLVMLSVRTSVAYEARAWAERLQKLGFAVVMGGPHVSACIDEVRSYANAAVHGEAELHLPEVIDAFEAGALTAATRPGLSFRSTDNCRMEESPNPDFALYRHSGMTVGTLEWGRGCQYQCTFCASTNLYTRSLRHKTNEQVLAEIERLPCYPFGHRVWFFGDDNFASIHAKTRSVSKAIGCAFPRAHWGCAITIASAADEALLDDMVEGGMRYVFTGIDSLVQESLTSTRKTLSKASEFARLIRNLKKRGVFVMAALVFGFDHDRPGLFASTLEWARETEVDVLNLNVVRPYPSSPLYAALKAQGRLVHDPRWLQPFETRVEMVCGLTPNIASLMTSFVPRHMTSEELIQGVLWVGQEFYKLRRTIPRLLKNAVGLAPTIVDALTNYNYARLYQSTRSISPPRVYSMPDVRRSASGAPCRCF